MSSVPFGSDRAFDDLLSFVAHQRGALRSDRDVFVEAMVLARSGRFYAFASVCAEARPLPVCKRESCTDRCRNYGRDTTAICDCCGQYYCTFCELLIEDGKDLPPHFWEEDDGDSSSDYVE